jgi:glycosyltransferase involved in cell wall biosynthesis
MNIKILFESDIIHHHFYPLAKELLAAVGVDNFRFALWNAVDDSRTAMRFPLYREPWIIDARKNPDLFREWYREADVVLTNIRNCGLIQSRLAAGKLTFLFSERFFKPGSEHWWKPAYGWTRLLYPPFLNMARRMRAFARSPYFYYCAIGTYAARDFRLLNPGADKILNWAYFTDTHESPAAPGDGARLDPSRLNILWCGRLLRWKRVDMLARVFARLARTRPEARLTIVGDGPEKPRVRKILARRCDAGRWTLLPFLKPEDVRRLMRQADIYVLPSTAYEGWGAVVNEAMAESCVVAACRKTGAGKTMFVNGDNGFLFDTEAQLLRVLDDLCASPALREQVVKRGLSTIRGVWSPEEAARRFIGFSKAFLAGEEFPRYTFGPMSFFYD